MSSLQIIDENKMEEKEVIECPICYDEIDQLKNCVTTECGHRFHCKCLMQNSATNGFSCPMCRSIMAEELADSDSEGEYEDEDEDEDEEIEDFDDNALTSFRMFHQQLAGEEVEEEVEVEDQDQELVLEEDLIVKPTAAIIAAKLIAEGYTMEYMVACLLIDHEEYETDMERYENCADRMFGKFRQIISNYPREMQQAVAGQAVAGQAGAVAVAEGERHQSTRLRIRAEVDVNIGCLQNRYHLLEDEDEV
jgi:hypothetical protein